MSLVFGVKCLIELPQHFDLDEPLVVIRRLVLDHLDRHDFLSAVLLTAKDLAKSASTKRIQNCIRTEAIATAAVRRTQLVVHAAQQVMFRVVMSAIACRLSRICQQPSGRSRHALEARWVAPQVRL